MSKKRKELANFTFIKAETVEDSSYKAIVIDGVDILFLRHHVAKATTCGVLKGNARGFGTQNFVNVIAVV